jgi:hypothetical protein
MIKKVPVNEYGKRIGEGHPRSRLTDEQIDRIRDLHEDHNLTYLQLGEMYSVPRTTIASICSMQDELRLRLGGRSYKLKWYR